jgi:hypothetical protein
MEKEERTWGVRHEHLTHDYYIRIENCGPLTVEDVSCELPGKTWKLHTNGMEYPIPAIEPGDSTRLMGVRGDGLSPPGSSYSPRTGWRGVLRANETLILARLGGLRASSPPRDLTTLSAHSPSFVCGHVHLDRAAASVGECNPHFCTLSVLDLLAAHIADNHSLARHDSPFSKRNKIAGVFPQHEQLRTERRSMASEEEKQRDDDGDGQKRDISKKLSNAPGTDEDAAEKVRKAIGEDEDGTTDLTEKF